MKKILMSLLVVGTMLMGGAILVKPAMAGEDSNNIPDAIGDICEDGNNIPDDLKEAAGCKVEKDKTAMPAVVYIINVALSLVGIVAVGMIVYGAITYVISTGDAVKLNRAKNSILYGLVGVVVASLAYTIVYFVSQNFGA